MRKTLPLCGALLLASIGSASAESITVDLTGRVMQVYDPAGAFTNQVTVGQEVTAEYTYDTSVADQMSDPQLGVYPQDYSQGRAKVRAGFVVFETDNTPGGPDADVQVYASEMPGVGPPYWSYFRIGYGQIKSLGNGAAPEAIHFEFMDENGFAPSSDALLTTAPNVSHFEQKYIGISGIANGQWFSIYIEIDSATRREQSSGVTVSPPTGSFLRVQRFDAALLLPYGSEVVGLQAFVNGVPAPFTYPQSCFMAPPTMQGRPAIFCPDAAWQLMDGANHVEWRVTLMDGTSLESAVDWEVIP